MIGFRGIGFHEAGYEYEPGLIRAGHVGIAFEDNETNIYGFHPSPKAMEQVGEDKILEQLKEGESFEGTIQQDQEIFIRAWDLAEQGKRSAVWQIAIEVADEEFERIQSQLLQWYNQEVTFTYAFPPRGVPLPPNQDNCATFFRRLGLSLPEPSGQLTRYIPVLENMGQRWKPEMR